MFWVKHITAEQNGNCYNNQDLSHTYRCLNIVLKQLENSQTSPLSHTSGTVPQKLLHSRYTHQVWFCLTLHLAALTSVSEAGLAPCGLGQQSFSLPPQPSQDGTLPPLYPDGFREHDTHGNQTFDTSLLICIAWFVFICAVCVRVSVYVPSAPQICWRATSLWLSSVGRWRFSLSRPSTCPPCMPWLSLPPEGSHGGLTQPHLYAHTPTHT